jgi:phage-related protein
MGLTHEEIVDNINTVYEFVSGSFSDFITGLTGWISDIGSNITGMWTDIQDWFTGGIDNVMVALGGWWDEISEWFSNLASNAVSWAGDMVSGFVGGIRDGIGSIGQGMSDLASEAASWIHFSTPDKGALADADEYMPDFIDLLAGGIDDNLPTIGASLENMSDYISNRMPSLDAGDAISNINAVSTIPMDNRAGQPIVVQAYFGNEKFDEYVVNSNQRTNFISGGRG